MRNRTQDEPTIETGAKLRVGHRMTTVLETSRLALREMDTADLDFVAEMLAHPEVMRFYPKCYSREEAEAWVQRQQHRYANDGIGIWLAFEKTTGKPVGQIGLVPQRVDGTEEPGLTYLIHRPFWRQGFATEAAVGCRDYAFDVLNAPRVICTIRPENTPSLGVAMKIGLRREKLVEYKGYEHVLFTASRLGEGTGQ